ncbi:cytochrome P450 [Mycena rebaudengoi]|nr:cytochrome P450 [Mycena rebaudengoi]
MFTLSELASLAVLAYGIYLVCRRLVLPRKYALPPGPRGLPLLGNTFEVPKSQEWFWFQEISQKFNSDIISLDLLGSTVIVLNSLSAANELLDNRSAIYSDRPVFTMINDLIGFTWHLGFMPYGQRWKEHRKAFVKEFQPSVVLFHRPLELEAARVLLQRLLDTPDKFEKHLRHMAGMIILSTAYGIDVRPENDPYVEISEKALHAMACAGNSGSYLVDSLPFLKHMPDFLPGAGFKRQAKDWYKTVSAMPVLPYQFVKDSLAAGTAKSSIASRALEEIGEDEDCAQKEEVLRNILGACYAGADTTVSALGTFILAMTLNPDIQKKAQEAVDKAVGSERLPDFSDNIPYVDAIVREVLRWRPVTPLGVPHAVTQDDVYKGYHIPAGSVVLANSWAILHDEETYGPNTDKFIPDRWIKDEELDPEMKEPDPAFGFGRRICPGKDMAQWSIWITVASILASFNISKRADENGATIELSGEYTSGLLCYPLPFECSIVPRSGTTKSLIQATFLDQT